MAAIGNEATPILVLIVDDDKRVRDVLTARLARSAAIVVCGAAANADAAVCQARNLQPDVALVDFHLPGGGRRAVCGILEQSPATRIVAISGSPAHDSALEMLHAGAASSIVKTASPDEIVATVIRVAHGESILSAEVAESVIGELTAHLDRRDLETGHIARTRAKIQIVLADGGVHPVFQPIVDLASGRTFGLEALSRFKCEPPQSPDRWFADAESVGLRAELEQHAAAKAVDHFRTHASDVFLSLNASPESLNGYLKLAAELGDRLVLEITEHFSDRRL
jgi:DNA-binding NarL/FixJ family response regulator